MEDDVSKMAISAKRIAASFAALSFLYLGLGAVFERDSFNLASGIKPFGDEAAIVRALEKYNAIFTDLYATSGVPAMLNEFPASKRLRHELFKDIGALRNRKTILVYDMASMDVREVKTISPSMAEATVFEEWNYGYQNADTRLPVGPLKGMGRSFKYVLVKMGGEWMVADYFPADSDGVPEGEVSD